MDFTKENILINPQTAIRLFATAYQGLGDELLIGKKYKRTREAWIASMFLLALKDETKKDWFMRPEYILGSPDFYGYSFFHDAEIGGTIMPQMRIEVFEWRKEQNQCDFVEAIKESKLNKIVDPQLTLVCYVRRSTTMPSIVTLMEKLREIRPKVKDIWYIACVSSDYKIWRVAQLYPNPLAIDLDYEKILLTKEDHSFVYPYRAKSNKLEFEAYGKQILLTPEFDIKPD